MGQGTEGLSTQQPTTGERSTEELSREIAGTRQALATDLDALQERVSPSAVMERRKAAARGKLRSVKDKVMGTVHDVEGATSDHASSAADTARSAMDQVQSVASSAPWRVEGSPLAAGLIAFGAGLVVSALIPASEKEAKVGADLVDRGADKAQPMMEEAKAVGQDVAQQLGERATEAVEEVKSSAAEGADRVKQEGQSAAESVRSDVRAD